MQTKAILEPKFTEHYFEYDNMKYFRDNAFMVEVGSFGEKKDAVGARAYLDVHAKVKTETIAEYVKFTTAIDINWNEVSSKEIGGSGQLLVFGLDSSAAVSTSYATAKTARVKLMNFQINEGPLVRMLNNEAPGARNYLAEEGADARICSGIWVWADVEIAEHFVTSTSISATVAAGSSGLQFTARGGKHGTRNVSVTSGTTCAYRLHKVKSWKDRDKKEIDNLETDFKGNG